MASKILYTVVAVVGIAAASGAAWWVQNKGMPNFGELVGKKTDATGTASGAASGTSPGMSPGASGAASAPSGPRAPSVEVAKVEVMKLIDDTQAVGNLKSRRSVIVRPEVGGRITQLNFKDGERVRRGQLLVQFDDLLPMAQVAQSRAEMSIAQANHKRNQDLAAQNFISARTVDESAAALEVSQAKLALSQATAARLKIIAPFDGMTGIRSVNPGDYLKDGADIVNIEDLDAVYVDFRLPERFFTKIKKGQRTNVDLDALPGRKFVGIVQAVDPLIDANGRSVGVRACIDNRQMQLRPGMFARVTAVFGERDRALVVPEEAIVPQGPKAFILKVIDGPDGTKVSQRVEVKLGIRRPGRVEVTEGLTAADVVIVAGQQRVQKDGIAVRVIDVNRAPGGPGGAPGGPGAAGVVGAAPATGASAPVVAASAPVKQKVAAPAPTPAEKPPEGPNPCLADLSDTTGGTIGGTAGGMPGGAAGAKP